ncbi:MAG: hypothetical protein R3B13_00945 [Polyangiaceae bacterium]
MNESGADRPEYVLPVVPLALDIDPELLALLHMVAFLDLSDDDQMDPEAAGDALEHVGMYMQRLGPERIAAFGAQLDRLARHAASEGWLESQQELVQEFLRACGVDTDADADAGD